MIATFMLQNGFELGFGLGKHFQGIVEPIQVPARGTKFCLGYVPIDADEVELMNIDADEVELMNKSADRMLARPMPHLYQSFSMQEHTIDNGLGEGISGMFEEVDAVMEDEAET
uniref:G-patch domain-containing protein n=1 Tax=Solanum tuberosum TaxID=4113 RepID=M1DZF0_SOLTU